MMFYKYGAMMGGGYSLLGNLIMIVVLVDLVLVGVWLWKKVK